MGELEEELVVVKFVIVFLFFFYGWVVRDEGRVDRV